MSDVKCSMTTAKDPAVKDFGLDYEIMIGCEIHCELKTTTKAFCACENRYGGMPNTRVCPVCLGLPGAMPIVSREYVEYGVIAGKALDCEINRFTKFDRKHYFYPDLVKGYQITQYDIPLCKNGRVKINTAPPSKPPVWKEVRIERIHLEEDVGKSLHIEGSHSYIDYNRSGVPLIEIVSKPDMQSPEEASAFMQTVREILRYIGVTDGNLEEGSMRCDANVNVVIRDGGEEFRTPISEIKNMNSFKWIRDACRYEVNRQIAEFVGKRSAGEDVSFNPGYKNTMGWDEAKGETVVQRTKNSFIDYRFVVEPDIKPFYLSDDFLSAATAKVGERPQEKRDRFKTEFGLSDFDATTLTSERELAEWFEAAAAKSEDPKKTANWVVSEILAVVNEMNAPLPKALQELKVSPDSLAELVNAVSSKVITSRQAKDVFACMLESGKSASAVIEEKGMKRVSDPAAIASLVAEVFSENASAVADYRAGKTNVAAWLVGQVMKKSRGQADPDAVAALVREKLGGADD